MKKPTDIEVSVELEKSKLNRQKSMVLMDKAMLLYLAFLFVAVVGFVTHFLNLQLLNMLVVLGFGVLVVGIVPYAMTMHREEHNLNTLLGQIKGKS